VKKIIFILSALIIGMVIIGVILDIQTRKEIQISEKDKTSTNTQSIPNETRLFGEEATMPREIQISEKEERFRKFNSIQEIRNFLNGFTVEASTVPPIPRFDDSDDLLPLAPPYVRPSTPWPPRFITSAKVTGTNDAEIVKTDGTYIYAITDNGVAIVKANPVEEIKVISKISLGPTYDIYHSRVGGTFLFSYNIFLHIFNDKLIVIWNIDKHIAVLITVLVYDIKDRAQPKLEWNVTVTGEGFSRYITSKMVGEVLYLITTHSLFDDIIRLPLIYNNGKEIKVQPSDVYYSPYVDYGFEFFLLIRLNIVSKSIEYSGFLLGRPNNIYISSNNIYITQYIFSWRWIKQTLIVKIEQDHTVIHRINIQNGIKYEAIGKVHGFILNQLSINEYNGYLRVVVASLTPNTSYSIYILNMDLKVVGKMENIKINEKVLSTRFIQDKCYLVIRGTYPLYVIDLTNIETPKILGYLKIPARSISLHPVNETLVLGIIEEGQGRGRISLFDLSNFENPKEIAKINIGNETRNIYSEAPYDGKAFLLDQSRGMLVLPSRIPNYITLSGTGPMSWKSRFGSGWSILNWMISLYWQGVLVFEIKKDGIYLKGNVTNINYNKLIDGILNDRLFDADSYYNGFARRALLIGDFLYTISFSKIKINNIYTLEEIKEIEL
jgi:uncharacterized secreted protein with C-terminal beta-propeller domain